METPRIEAGLGLMTEVHVWGWGVDSGSQHPGVSPLPLGVARVEKLGHIYLQEDQE